MFTNIFAKNSTPLYSTKIYVHEFRKYSLLFLKSKLYLSRKATMCWLFFFTNIYMTKQSRPADSGRGRRGASEWRVQSHSTPSEAKPGSLWTCGPAPSPAATSRVCHRPPDCTRGSPHSGWNDKIVVLKKTKLLLYFKTFIEKINSGNFIM